MIIKRLLSKLYRELVPISTTEMYKKMGVKVGENSHIQNGVIIDYSHYWLIEIGNNVTIAPNVHILAHDASTKRELGYTRIARVLIMDSVFIGAGSVIMPGVTIGENSIIGAGSIVTKNVPPNSVFVGNPARFITTTQEYFSKKKQEFETTTKFDESYTLRNKISNNQKSEMLLKLKDGPGYII